MFDTRSEGALMHNLFAFVGGKIGKWQVLSVSAVVGRSLDPIDRIDVRPKGTVSPILAPGPSTDK